MRVVCAGLNEGGFLKYLSSSTVYFLFTCHRAPVTTVGMIVNWIAF